MYLSLIHFAVRAFDDELFDVLGRKFSVGILRDHLRNWAPTIVALSMFSGAAFAGTDLNVGAVARHYPLSGVIEAEGGYGHVLRGTENGPFSSYIRARAYLTTVGFYNTADGAIEFYPLAITGFRAGGEIIQNNRDYTPYDCEKFRCTGQFHRTYVEGELTLGAGPVFAQARWKRSRWSQPRANAGDFIDPTSAIAIKSDGDSETVYYGVVGYKVSENWTALGVLRYSETDQLGGYSRFPYGVVRWKSGPLSIGAGVGVFESSLKDKDVAAVGLIRYEVKPSVSVR